MPEYQKHMEDYTKDFNLLKGITFGASVNKVRTNDDSSNWVLDVEKGGTTKTTQFDRVAFCNGNQTKADNPTSEGQDKLEGTTMNSRAYREYVNLSALDLINHHLTTRRNH
jgi:cation diffusion facilitator CzcD-associated flavoprotein CzcO